MFWEHVAKFLGYYTSNKCLVTGMSGAPLIGIAICLQADFVESPMNVIDKRANEIAFDSLVRRI